MKKLKIYLIPSLFLFCASLTGAYFNLNEKGFSNKILVPKEIKRETNNKIKTNSLMEKYKNAKRDTKMHKKV